MMVFLLAVVNRCLKTIDDMTFKQICLLLMFQQLISCNSILQNDFDNNQMDINDVKYRGYTKYGPAIGRPVPEDSICRKNFTIKNFSHQMNELKHCIRIEGCVRIVLMDKESADKMNTISYPNLIEITDYLLIFHMPAVTTLDFFPNLQSIRGYRTFEGNALIVSGLENMTRFGFNRLEHIKGGVRLEKADSLCLQPTDRYTNLVQAIKSPSIQSNESQQLLPGFKFWSDGPNKLDVKWNHSPIIGNITVDHFDIELIEFDDLDIYYKTVDKYKCQTPNITAIGQHSDYYSQCNTWPTKKPPLPLIIDNRTKGNINDKNFVAQPFFIFSTVQNIMSLAQMSVKFMSFYKSADDDTNYGTHSVTNQNEAQRPDIKPFDPKIYRIFRVFREESKDNNTKYSWNNVKHFRHYYMIIHACTNSSTSSSCSVVAHHKLRTGPIDNCDNIVEQSVNSMATHENITINWLEPEKPNGAIISYQILFHESNDKTNKKLFCLNRTDFIANDNKFIIDKNIYNITPNTEYSFKLRATSMNGPSNYTRYIYINTTKSIHIDPGKDKGTPTIIYLTIGLTSILALFVFTATICYMKAPKRHKLVNGGFSVNPEYEKFIVDPEWEIKKSDLKMFHVLGDGAFGRVYYGELRTNNKIVKCAVKTLNSDRKTSQRDSFLKEANIMKSFVNCHHIVKLIGIISESNPVYVLMEYMINGDLKTYLRANRPENDENPNPRVPTWPRIFQMAIEIADGMAYLAANKFVHRDLAARNCMIAEDLTVKIGDFGMTRDIYDNDYYRKRDCGILPVRWMSPEALRDNIFTTYSDIWAYGVVLWEMVTLGAQPYQGYSNDSVFQNIIRGVRLTEPDNCPKKLWQIMECCWIRNPKRRPTFDEITEYLLPSANQSFREVCYYLNRKPFAKKPQSLKKIWYSLLPNNKLLLDDGKQINGSEYVQYCKMEPQIHRKINLLNNDYTGHEVKFLNKLNENSVISMNDINQLNETDKQNEQIIQQKSIDQCFN